MTNSYCFEQCDALVVLRACGRTSILMQIIDVVVIILRNQHFRVGERELVGIDEIVNALVIALVLFHGFAVGEAFDTNLAKHGMLLAIRRMNQIQMFRTFRTRQKLLLAKRTIALLKSQSASPIEKIVKTERALPHTLNQVG